MEIRRQDVDFTLGGKDSAISCPVGVHPVIAVMLSIIAFQQTLCAVCALLNINNFLRRSKNG